MAELAAETIRGALALAKRHGFDKIELRAGESRFSATIRTRGGAKRVAPPSGTTSTASGPTEVRSKAVGYAHPAALSPGDQVKEGARLATIETLGIADDLVAPRAGVLRSFAVEDGDPVEFGQVVAVLEAL